MFRVYERKVNGVWLTLTELPNGVVIANLTSHPLTFGDSNRVYGYAPPSGFKVTVKNAKGLVGGDKHKTVYSMVFHLVNHKKTLELLKALKKEGIIAIGSMLAAQHVPPGLLYCGDPVPGYERVPKDQKRIKVDSFLVRLDKNTYKLKEV